MDEKKIDRAVKRHWLEDSLRQDCLGTISERVSRLLELDFIQITPNEHFASVSAQCILLYRDGYFFACIALCQAVAEAVVRFMCEKSDFGASISKDFEQNVGSLRKRNIKPDCGELFKEIWEGRHDYHHLKPEVPTEITKLKDIAKGKIIALHRVESEVFAFKMINGAIEPKYSKYWEVNNGLLNVFLRIEP